MKEVQREKEIIQVESRENTRSLMDNLPKVVEDLIWYYVGVFQTASDRPSLRAIQRLINRSNKELRTMLSLAFFDGDIPENEIHPVPLLMWMYRAETAFGLHNSLFAKKEYIRLLLTTALRKRCPNTSALSWLFRVPTSLPFQYYMLFRSSILYELATLSN